jgi:hypothetical protein
VFPDDYETEYHYDIGYYEGVRNTLQIIHKSLIIASKNEEERVQLLLKMVGEELDNAIKEQKSSENRLFDEEKRY